MIPFGFLVFSVTHFVLMFPLFPYFSVFFSNYHEVLERGGGGGGVGGGVEIKWVTIHIYANSNIRKG